MSNKNIKFELFSLSFGNPIGEDNGKILREQLKLKDLEKTEDSFIEIVLPGYTVSSSFLRGLVGRAGKKYKITLRDNEIFDCTPILRRLEWSD